MGKMDRNEKVDILRGIAMLMVVLGHTMTGSTVGSENTFLYNVIWSLQMPLFMLISGYVNRYSSGVKSLTSFIGKKSFAYLLPWAVWSFLIRGFIFGQTNFLNIKWLLWNMDSGYWFLFSIWMITMVFGASNYLGKKLGGSEVKEVVITTIVYVVGMGILAGIGLVAGLSFLCIKLTLYYMPFYYLGYLFGKCQSHLEKLNKWDNVKDILIAVSAFLWLVSMARINLFSLNDNLVGIAIRFLTSLFGCVFVCGVVPDRRICGIQFSWVGKNSLQVYLTHYLLLNLVKTDVMPSSSGTLCGMTLVAVNFSLTIALVFLVILLINRNKVLSKVVYGK